MEFYDAHIHFLFKCPRSDIKRILDYLAGIGLRGFNALVIAEYPDDIATVLKMVPEEYHKDINLEVLDNQRDPFPLLKESSQIIPYLDARFIEKDIEKKIIMYRRMGFEGLKLLYVPEEDDVLRIQGMKQALRRSYKQSEKVTSLLIESAASQGLSILIHIDLRKHGEFIEEMIKGHPLTNFNIAHFGFSRRVIAPLLEKYDNCYSDFASLIPFMKTDSVSYLDFIKSYPNRILFASDTLIGQPQTVQDATQFISGFLKDPGLQERIFRENYLSFHKRSVKT